MNTDRMTARIVGVLFLVAMVSSLLGGALLEVVIGAPDYLAGVAANTTQLGIGVFLEFVNGVAVIGIAVVLFLIFKRTHERLAVGYLGFRILESVFLIVAAIIPLLLVTLSRESAAAGAADAGSYLALGSLLLAVRAELAGLLVPVFFSLSALLFYTWLYQSKLLPRFIAVWGLIAVVLIFTVNFLDVGIATGLVFALPIITNEIFLGIWLIVRGFSPAAVAPGPARTGVDELRMSTS